MEQNSLPIGVFDSGLGGLTVLSELTAALPLENFVYLGDVARLPYGSKSGVTVTRYASSCVQFLLARPVKAVVIACNTATAMALEALRRELSVPLHGVIAPAAARALELTRNGKILVLATESTVRTEAYRREFFRLAGAGGYGGPSLQIQEKACPLLVPLVEEGWFDTAVTQEVIRHYLESVRDAEYDTVVLGCTHYPFLERSFRQVMGPDRVLVHSGASVAAEVKRALEEGALQNPRRAPGRLQFFSTDPIPKSLPILRGLFGGVVDFELVDL